MWLYRRVNRTVTLSLWLGVKHRDGRFARPSFDRLVKRVATEDWPTAVSMRALFGR